MKNIVSYKLKWQPVRTQERLFLVVAVYEKSVGVFVDKANVVAFGSFTIGLYLKIVC